MQTGVPDFPSSPSEVIFGSLEELRRWRSGGWREESFVVEQENKVMLVILQNQSYMSYHEKISTKRIPTCEKPSKKIIKTLLHSDSALTCCKKYGRMPPGKQKLLKSDASPL